MALAGPYHSFRDIYPNDLTQLATSEEVIPEEQEQRAYRTVETEGASRPVTRVDALKLLGVAAVAGLLLYLVGIAK